MMVKGEPEPIANGFSFLDLENQNTLVWKGEEYFTDNSFFCGLQVNTR